MLVLLGSVFYLPGTYPVPCLYDDSKVEVSNSIYLLRVIILSRLLHSLNGLDTVLYDSISLS